MLDKFGDYIWDEAGLTRIRVILQAASALAALIRSHVLSAHKIHFPAALMQQMILYITQQFLLRKWQGRFVLWDASMNNNDLVVNCGNCARQPARRRRLIKTSSMNSLLAVLKVLPKRPAGSGLPAGRLPRTT